MTSDFEVAVSGLPDDFRVSARLYQPGGASVAWLILAHGAGAGHDSSFIVSYASGLATRGVTAVTFNFPYTQRGRRVPDSRPVLESCWQVIIGAVRTRAGRGARIVAGGKSMGGRIASQVAAVSSHRIGTRRTRLSRLSAPSARPARSTSQGALAVGHAAGAVRPGHTRCLRLARRTSGRPSRLCRPDDAAPG